MRLYIHNELNSLARTELVNYISFSGKYELIRAVKFLTELMGLQLRNAVTVIVDIVQQTNF